jgi:hypothetical protein
VADTDGREQSQTSEPADAREGFIPEQVRRMGQRADELQRQLISENPEEDTPEPADGEPTTGEQLELPSIPPPQPPPTDWEQRYRTLQGKYDAETGAMRGQLAAMERLLATMQAPPAAPAAPVPPTGGPAQYNEADVELYGQDLLDAAARAADARYAGTISQLQNRINQLEGGQAHLSGAAQQDRVFRTLDADPELVGRWDRLNTDPQFLEWLQGIDEFSGLSRNTMLQHAYNSGDAIRTGRFFKRFMAEHGHTVAPPSLPAASQTGATPARDHNSNGRGNGYAAAGGPRLEDMAAPGRAAGSGAGNGAPQQRIWSRSDIKAFYRDRTDGKFKGREAEAQRLEEDLFLADVQGRLV